MIGCSVLRCSASLLDGVFTIDDEVDDRFLVGVFVGVICVDVEVGVECCCRSFGVVVVVVVVCGDAR